MIGSLFSIFAHVLLYFLNIFFFACCSEYFQGFGRVADWFAFSIVFNCKKLYHELALWVSLRFYSRIEAIACALSCTT